VAQPKVESYVKLVAKKALSTWRKLPPNARAWIDLEDLIQDGILFTKFKALPKFRPHRSNIAHYLNMCLDQYYERVLMACFAKMRNACSNVPLEAVDYKLFARQDSIEQEIHAVESLKKIARQASPNLQKYLQRWLVTHNKVHCRGPLFFVAKKELLELSQRYNFDRTDMEFLLRDETWRKTVTLPQPLKYNY